MAISRRSLHIDMQQREIETHGTPMFPCGVYINQIGDNLMECVPWHWHEEVELIAVASGTMRLEVPDDTIVAGTGDAVFINASILHSAVSADGGLCEIYSLVFDPRLIFGFLQSAIEQKYVRPLVKCRSLPVIHFTDADGWQRDAIRCIREAFDQYETEAYGHELLVRDALSRLWFLIVANQRSEIEQHQSPKNIEAVRVKEMLAYVHANYTEPVALRDIAGAVAISERECSRCFNRVLGISPMKYLLSYRVSVAAGLLADSSLNITEICKLAGFESPSYFSLKFKALTGLTPSQYRSAPVPPPPAF